MYSAVQIFFDHIYESIPGYIPFKPEWQNHSYNRAISMDKGLLPDGAMSTTLSPEGLRTIVIGYEKGNIVLSEQDEKCRSGYVLCQMPEEMHRLFRVGPVLTTETFRKVIDPTLMVNIIERMMREPSGTLEPV